MPGFDVIDMLAVDGLATRPSQFCILLWLSVQLPCDRLIVVRVCWSHGSSDALDCHLESYSI